MLEPTPSLERNELVEIVVDDVRVVATPDHPFFTQDKRWKPAGQLAAGDLLFDETNPEGRVIWSVERRQEACTVYNMEVEGLHNFFVTSAGILTHNLNAGFNHYFQRSFGKAFGNTLGYGKASLGTARLLGKRAHTRFHKMFNEHLIDLDMLPVRGRSSKDIVKNMTFEQVVQKFRPFFDKPEVKKAFPNGKELFDQEVRVVRNSRR